MEEDRQRKIIHVDMDAFYHPSNSATVRNCAAGRSPSADPASGA
jgi:nucleotidyltransferase/DNA polymerase involved in DNA repair